jgi:YidC/Oxa1 family membrane protein insertase
MGDIWNQFILNPFTNVLLWIYSNLGHNANTFGIAIILFTILIRLVTWPLNGQQLKGAKAMQDLQNDKEWKDIQKKYAKDREKLAQEQMRIYKERGINPFASCLPTLIQFPIIIGLYQSITHVLAGSPLGLLQLARSVYSFLNIAALIPVNSKFLWMDLGRPEGIPFPGGFLVSFLPYGFPTLAIIVAITTYLQTKLTMPPPTSGTPNDQGAAMNNMMSIYMPLFLGYLVLNYASGLAVYFVTSNVLGIVQYAMMGRVNWRNLLPGAKQPVVVSKKK